ncbi:DUF2239 family protein [Phenylobacterium sp. RIFCSPHIGHO2_01_FULL_69_31]|uniref:DUF2239 family protein n=1 Tax=Phenylobacterium sp. RIFCSPHIGHO2_01_FULL_69_31 TaxID=1801944 RepID=UPI0025F96A18|nr:DUF2239 family protein [Phenylobacterium sp. RIFCSPHIGHO2_01_FULL_69_31]
MAIYAMRRMEHAATFTAFIGQTLAAAGSIETVAGILASNAAVDSPPQIFEDATGRPVELDLRYGPAAAVAEYRTRVAGPSTRPGRGRPKLGVVAREVTLLPRHWEWLAGQPGGASATLRRLVEEARRADTGPDRIRLAREAAYRVMSALAGDLPGFEEASRALFAGDLEALEARAAGWPSDIRSFVLRLANGG